MQKKVLSSNLLPFLFLAFLSGMLGGVLVAGYERGERVTDEPTGAHTLEAAMIEVAQNAAPSVVSIVPTRDLPIYQSEAIVFDNSYYESLIFGDLNQPHVMTLGSGFVVREDGWIITSAHVVDEKNLLYSVIFEDGRVYQASDIVFAETDDMALLHLQDKAGQPPSGLPTAYFGDSDRLRVGQLTLSIGSTPGSARHSVSSGIISALDRSISAGGYDSRLNLSHLIQTDSAIQPGSSGGPLINLDGEIVGMNTAVTTDGGNMGFAIPSNNLRDFISKQLAL